MAASPSPTAKSSSRPPATSISAVRTTLRRLEAEMDGLTDVDEAPGLRKRVAAPALRARIPARIERQQHGLLARAPRLWRREPTDRSPTPRAESGRRRATPFCRPRPSTSPSCCHELVFETIPTVVLTSATLTVQGGFEHMRKRLGLDGSPRARRAVALPLRRAGAALSAAQHARSARSRISPKPPPAASGACSKSRKAAPSASSPATARCATSTSACCPVLDFPILLHGTAPAQSAARGIPLHAQRRPLRHRPASGRESTCRAKR